MFSPCTDTFPAVTIGGQSTSNWEVIRQTANHQSTGPIEDVSSRLMSCYELNTSGPWSDTGVLNVQAGDSVSFTSSPAIFHPGPALAYLAKVPAGTDVTQWDASGAVWFKIWQDEPTISSSDITFPTMGALFSIYPFPYPYEESVGTFSDEVLTVIRLPHYRLQPALVPRGRPVSPPR